MRHQQHRQGYYSSGSGFPFGFCILGFFFLMVILKGAFIWPFFWIFLLLIIFSGGAASCRPYRSYYTSSQNNITEKQLHIKKGYDSEESIIPNNAAYFCTNCGHENDSEDKFCYQCGFKVKNN